MTQITLRGMDDKLEKTIRRMAREKGTSLNKVVLDMVRQHMGLKTKTQEHPGESLRKLAGGWSKKQAADFMESINSCEQIDEAMWK